MKDANEVEIAKKTKNHEEGKISNYLVIHELYYLLYTIYCITLTVIMVIVTYSMKIICSIY